MGRGSAGRQRVTEIQEVLQGEVLAPGEWTPEQAADYVVEAWQKAVSSIVETGDRLKEAKKRVGHGNWLATVERLPFSARTAQRLMEISSHRDISNATSWSHLPASWTTLYVLSQLPTGEIPRRIEAREITPEIDGPTAQQWVSTYAVARQEALNEWGGFADAITAGLSYVKTWTPPADTDTYATVADVIRRIDELADIAHKWETELDH